ncbi:CoA ester lyase [Mycobacterium sp. DL592]|uniref:HpcH/HpaI aldolase/citrate lyase family protein n=1 Tax=Mycobacterium sp. DL592 TaxID=2675524 RepID=UPI0014243314|nr:CoA ester lyase [Mycobacterium sp. DL592]
MTSSIDPERYRFALHSGADICTVDLEDAVPPDQRVQARRQAAEALAFPSPRAMRGLRINSVRSADGLRDILCIIDGQARPDTLLVPKVNSAEDLLILDELLGDQLAGITFLATIETAAGLAAVEEIAGATPRLRALVFGAADLSAELGVSMEWEPLLYARSRIVAAAAAGGIAAIDAPTFDLHDDRALLIDVRRGRNVGFTGKAAIHPRQVPVINAGFTPTSTEVDRARRIVRLADDHSGRIAVLDGQMLGPPMVNAANRILQLANVFNAHNDRDSYEPIGAAHGPRSRV